MARRSKSQYRQREYNRLLNNAREAYYESSIGRVLKGKTPTFEEVVKASGTSVDLKQPSLKSLKALRQLQDVEGILRNAQKTLDNRVGKDFKEYQELQKRINILKKIDKEIKRARKEEKDIFGTYQTSSEDARNYENIIKDYINKLHALDDEITNKKKGKFLSPKEYTIHHNIRDLIDSITEILSNGDMGEIEKLYENLVDRPAPTREEFYDDIYEYTKMSILEGISGMYNSKNYEDEYFATEYGPNEKEYAEPAAEEESDWMLDAMEEFVEGWD